MSWHDDAACLGLDTDAFYADGQGVNHDWRIARRICLACPVADPCLEAAITEDDRWGMRGGLTPRQRRDLKRHSRTDQRRPA